MTDYARSNGGPNLITANSDVQVPFTNTSSVRRRPKACDSCWQRKIRCNDGDGPCRNCHKYSQRCTVTRADGSLLVRGGDEPPLLPRDTQVASRKRQISPGLSEVDAVPRPAVRSRASRTPNSSIACAYHHEFQQQQAPADYASTSHSSINLDPLASGQSLLSKDSLAANGFEGVVLIEPIEDPQKCIYVGKTSTQVLAKSAEEFSKHDGFNLRVMEFFCPLLNHAEEVTLTARPKQPPLIGKALALQCVNAFFDTVPRTLPFMNELQFRKNFDDYYEGGDLDEPVNTCCIYLVIAIGARSLPDSDAISTSHFSGTWAMYNVIIASPYLTSVQCLILMTLELMNQNKEGQAIFAIGTAVRMAQSLGLHRALSAHKAAIELTFVEKNYHLRSCIWWTCYCLDKKLSFEFGRLSIINDTDCDVDTISVLTPGIIQGHTSGAEPQPTVFPSLIKICQILSTIMVRLFSRTANPNDEQSLLRQIASVDKMLLEWKNNLPQIWTTDPELIGADMAAQSADSLVLHCMYYNAMLVIHRAALFGKLPMSAKDQQNQRIASAETVCLNASRSLAKCINILTYAPASWPFLRWTTTYSLNVVFTLYMGVMKDPCHWMADADIGLMKSIVRCFASSCSHQIAVNPFKGLLQTLQEAMQTARARKHDSTSTADQDLSTQPEPDATRPLLMQRTTTTNDLDELLADKPQWVGFDADLQYQDFFDFGAGGETTNVFQFWPMDLGAGTND